MRSIFGKLLALHLAGTLLVASLLYLGLDWRVSTRLEQFFVTNGEMVADALAKSVEPFLIDHDMTSVQSSLDQVLSTPGVKWAYVTATDGTVLAHTFVPSIPEWLPSMPPQSQRSSRIVTDAGTGQSLTVFSQPALTGIVGAVHVGFDRGELVASIHKAEKVSLAAILGIMVLGTIAFGAFGSQLTLPLRELTQVVNGLVENARATTISLPVRSRDEVGVLTRAFNRMVAEIQRHYAELDATVQERTRALLTMHLPLKLRLASEARRSRGVSIAHSGYSVNLIRR